MNFHVQCQRFFTNKSVIRQTEFSGCSLHTILLLQNRIYAYPGFGSMLIISSGMVSSSHGEIWPTSKELTLETTVLKSSTVAAARGSTVFITQLDDVRKFSEYLDTSDTDISTIYKNRTIKLKRVYFHKGTVTDIIYKILTR